jgi:hypothetical protein
VAYAIKRRGGRKAGRQAPSLASVAGAIACSWSLVVFPVYFRGPELGFAVLHERRRSQPSSAVVAQLKLPGDDLVSRHSENKAFPFRAYVTFNREGRSRWTSWRQLIFVDSRMTNSGSVLTLALTMAKCRSTDQVAALTSLGGLLVSRGEIDTVAIAIINFIEQSAPMLRKAMEQRP